MNSRTVFDATNKIWSGEGGSSLPKYDTKMSLGSAILSALKRYPDKIGQVSLVRNGNRNPQFTFCHLFFFLVRLV